MHATLPLLRKTDFPAIRRDRLTTLQVNLGYTCNQTCNHCHVNAGPNRTEQMDEATIEQVLQVIQAQGIKTLDLTGGAPELNQHFRSLVQRARAMGVEVMDRCNLTILSEPGQEGLAQFLADHQVQIVASLPCYSQENVDKQRGNGVFERSISGLQQLNALGYGQPNSSLQLHLVYNPLGPSLPPNQQKLHADYTRMLHENFGIRFNQLFALANMPIARFGSTLVSKGTFDQYMGTLKGAHQDSNLAGVMCKSLISVDWQGYLYDCDFNQMLGLPLLPDAQIGNGLRDKPRLHLQDLIAHSTDGFSITVADHCYGCTAGQGSSCGGALN